jgi:hypothetical protein
VKQLQLTGMVYKLDDFCGTLTDNPVLMFRYELTFFRCASEVGMIATSSDDSTVSPWLDLNFYFCDMY